MTFPQGTIYQTTKLDISKLVESVCCPRAQFNMFKVKEPSIIVNVFTSIQIIQYGERLLYTFKKIKEFFYFKFQIAYVSHHACQF